MKGREARAFIAVEIDRHLKVQEPTQPAEICHQSREILAGMRGRRHLAGAGPPPCAAEQICGVVQVLRIGRLVRQRILEEYWRLSASQG